MAHVFDNLTVAQLINKIPEFNKSRGILLCSHEPAAGPYRQPDKSNPDI
jgi:hypothetical protein